MLRWLNRRKHIATGNVGFRKKLKWVEEFKERPDMSKLMKIHSAFLEVLHLDGQKGKNENNFYIVLLSFHFQTHLNSRTVSLQICRLLPTNKHSACHIQRHTAQHIYCTDCTVCNWTVLTVITQKLLLHVQLHNSTAHLLYKYCTNCTVCNWTVLTVIIQKLLLHVQLHNSTAHLLYK